MQHYEYALIGIIFYIFTMGLNLLQDNENLKPHILQLLTLRIICGFISICFCLFYFILLII